MALSLPDRAALGHVMTRGLPWERWRARRLLGAGAPLPEGWAAMQNPDGGWRSRELDSPVSNMGTTAMMLMRMAFVRLGGTPEAQRTIEYLWQAQQPDGRWAEDPAQWDAGPPEWNRPGDLEVELWETSNNAAVLAALGFARDPRAERAAAWVEAHARPDGSFPGYLHPTYAMAAYRHVRGEADRAEHYLQAGLRFLSEHGAKEWFDTMDLTWALMLWYLGGVPGDHPAVRAYLEALGARRRNDGTWPTRYLGFEIQFTLEAVELRQAFAPD